MMFKVATFYEPSKRKPVISRVRTYTRDYNPDWEGCVVYSVDAENASEARRAAQQSRLERELAAWGPYPQSERLIDVRPQQEIITEFLEWLQYESKVVLCRDEGHRGTSHSPYEPIRERMDQLLASYFSIDLVELERERRRMLSQVGENR